MVMIPSDNFVIVIEIMYYKYFKVFSYIIILAVAWALKSLVQHKPVCTGQIEQPGSVHPQAIWTGGHMSASCNSVLRYWHTTPQQPSATHAAQRITLDLW